MVTSTTKDARFVQPPEVVPWGLAGVGEGAWLVGGGVVAAGGEVAVGEDVVVGVGLAVVPAGVVARTDEVAVCGCLVSVGFGRLAEGAVGVVDAALA
jgi:hypothetical protein